MRYKLLVVGVLLVLSIFSIVILSSTPELEDATENNTEKPDIVYDPSTGETWDSVEEYVYRNKTEVISK